MRTSRRLAVVLAVLTFGLVPSAQLAAQTKTPKSVRSKAGPKKKPNLRKVHIHLMDGSLVVGELTIDTIEVRTDFGTLTVPVERILSITPGLNSHIKLSARIAKLVKDLGGEDFKTREAAHKELLGIGPPIRDVLAEHRNDKNRERKRHITAIVAKLDEITGNDDFGVKRTWSRFDIVVTPDFTIMGDVSPSVFQVRSKYGTLKIGLTDIRRTEQADAERGPTMKTITVAGTNLMLRTLKSSGIRLKVGDSVSVTATGSLSITPYGRNARTGPAGSSRYSSYTVGGQRFYSGTLVARIGVSGKWIRIGTRAKFTAKRSGHLKFGIAMRSSYSRGNYVFPGGYKVRIKVEPRK